jgi:hypothetical protein
METKIIGSVGPFRAALGADTVIRLGADSETIMQQLHARYVEQTVRGNIFSAANQAAQAVSVALATTYTGLCLYNPVGSGKILVPNKIKYALSVAPAAIATLGLITGYSATGGVTALTTRLSVQATQIGSAAVGVGIALSAATIVTPTWLQQLLDGFTAAALPAPTAPIDLDGLYAIYPGGFIAVGALTAVTGLGSIAWEEIPMQGLA